MRTRTFTEVGADNGAVKRLESTLPTARPATTQPSQADALSSSSTLSRAQSNARTMELVNKLDTSHYEALTMAAQRRTILYRRLLTLQKAVVQGQVALQDYVPREGSAEEQGQRLLDTIIQAKQAFQTGNSEGAAEALRGLRKRGAMRLIRDVRTARAAQREYDAALNEIVGIHERYLGSVARKYADNKSLLQESIQDGRLGLVRAIELFDVAQGRPLLAYANKLVRQAMLRGKMQSRGVPSHVEEARRMVSRVQARTYAQTGREATLEELQAATGLPEASIRGIWRASRFATQSLSTAKNPDHTPPIDRIPDSRVTNAEETLTRGALTLRLLEALTERERYVIERTYGLNGAPEELTSTIAARLGACERTIVQIRYRATKKMAKHRHTLERRPAGPLHT